MIFIDFHCFCIVFYWSSLIFIDYHWFLLFFIVFQWLSLISIHSYWFSLIFIDFHCFSMIFIDFHWFSLVFIDFHSFSLILSPIPRSFPHLERIDRQTTITGWWSMLKLTQKMKMSKIERMNNRQTPAQPQHFYK